MTTDGVLTHEYPLPREHAIPLDRRRPGRRPLLLAALRGSIARMALDGTVTKPFRLPTGYPTAWRSARNGDLWFTQGSHAQVGRVDLRWDPPILAAGTTFAMKRWVSAERTVATFTDADPEDRYDVTIKWGDGTDVGRLGAAYRERLRGSRPPHL